MMLVSDAVLVAGFLPNLSSMRSRSGLTAFAAGRENSGSCPTRKMSGFDNPAGVSSRRSRSPGSALVASVIRTMAVSAMAGLPCRLGGFLDVYKRQSRISPARRVYRLLKIPASARRAKLRNTQDSPWIQSQTLEINRFSRRTEGKRRSRHPRDCRFNAEIATIYLPANIPGL